MELSVVNTKGKDTGKKVKLSKNVFGVEPNDHAIYLDVKQYLANQRQGTHKSKERADIVGSTKKIKKQKGTGTARAGSIKSPVFRGGGRVFGPRPRNYSFKLNKKLKGLARKSALSYRAKTNDIYVVEDFSFDKPKTKDFVSMMEALNLNGKKILLLTGKNETNLYKSGRNISKVNVLEASKASTYDILNNQLLILQKSAIDAISETFKDNEEKVVN